MASFANDSCLSILYTAMGKVSFAPLLLDVMSFFIFMPSINCSLQLRATEDYGPGHDQGIRRALEPHPEAVSWNLEIEFCVVTGLNCSVKTYMTGLSNEFYFIVILFMSALPHNKLQ